jgi:hypothetical protein
MSKDLETELVELKTALNIKREAWNSASFISEHFKDCDRQDLVWEFRKLFQKFDSELEALEASYTGRKEEVINLYREEVKSGVETRKITSNLFKLSSRKTYGYNLEVLDEEARLRGIDPTDFYVISKKFEPNRVPETLKEILQSIKFVKSVSAIVKEREDS